MGAERGLDAENADNGEEDASMGVDGTGDAEDTAAFETMKTPLERAVEGKPKIRAVPVMTIYLSRVRVDALKSAFGYAHSSTCLQCHWMTLISEQRADECGLDMLGELLNLTITFAKSLAADYTQAQPRKCRIF